MLCSTQYSHIAPSAASKGNVSGQQNRPATTSYVHNSKLFELTALVAGLDQSYHAAKLACVCASAMQTSLDITSATCKLLDTGSSPAKPDANERMPSGGFHCEVS